MLSLVLVTLGGAVIVLVASAVADTIADSKVVYVLPVTVYMLPPVLATLAVAARVLAASAALGELVEVATV
jgi:hypothetical protein